MTGKGGVGAGKSYTYRSDLGRGCVRGYMLGGTLGGERSCAIKGG